MTENCCWMQGRLFILWQCVRDQTEQIEKIPPPYTFYLYFCIFNFLLFFVLLIFAMFCIVMGYFLFSFDIFFVFFMFTIFGIPDIERRKTKKESFHRPTTTRRIFIRM